MWYFEKGGFLLAERAIFPPQHGFPWPVPMFCPFLTDLGSMGKQDHFTWVVEGAVLCSRERQCVCLDSKLAQATDFSHRVL